VVEETRDVPSLAESAVVGISQMTFLWTVMSVFNVVANVVANINNNQNNRNNNNNNLNINKISTQNTQISANTNNANTISIMLPPPIPVLGGGRQLDAQQRLKRFVERENKLKRRAAEASFKNTSISDSSIEYSVAAFNTLQEITNIYKEDYSCLGRRLCHLGQTNRQTTDSSLMESIVLRLSSFGLMWIQLEDRSQSFIQFLENVTKDDFDEYLDCDLIFCL